MKKVYWWLFLAFALCLGSCSSTSQIAKDESRQAAAMTKLTVLQQKKEGQIANLTQEVKFLLSIPLTDKTVPVANQLLNATLTLTGPAIANESSLETEVENLLSTKAKNEIEIQKITEQNKEIQANLDKANGQVAKTTTTLYQAALRIAAADDMKSTIFHLIIGVIVFIVVMILLRLFLQFTATGASIAAKIPW